MTGAVDFLRHILPPTGPYIAWLAGARPFNVFAATIDELWAIQQRYDGLGKTVYHACASFREARHDPKGTKQTKRALGRTASNVAMVRALWLDLDAGPEKPYPAARAAAAAVLAFCATVGLPRPVLVSSGGGVHAYWPLAEAIPADEWTVLAKRFKALTIRHNLHADATRTADVASVLRTPGTHNRKYPDRTVACGELFGPYAKDVIVAVLDAQGVDVANEAPRRVAASLDLGLGPRPNWLDAEGAHPFPDISAFDDVSAAVIAEQCGQMRAMRDSKGKMLEPLWHACLGVAAFCQDGDRWAHEHSTGDARYSDAETQEKLDRCRELSGPTTCERFHGLEPATCERCPLWGRITSPTGAVRGLELAPEVTPPKVQSPPQADQSSVSETLPRDAGPVTKANGHHALVPELQDLPPATEEPAQPAEGEFDFGAAPAEGGKNDKAPSRFIRFPDLDAKGLKRATCRNARVAIDGLGVTCEHDTFHGKMLVGGHLIDQWSGELSDDAVQMLRVVIERYFAFDPGLANTHDAAVQECLQRPFDPVAQYLAGLKWDGRARVAGWLSRYLGAEDTKLNRAIGALGLMAAVRRVRAPGTKFDQIIVLESPEGRGKSSAIEILAGAENFSDQTILTLDDKGQQEAVQGVWLYEIADLAGMPKADIEKVKAFASRKVDRARPAYGRARVDRPRRCVFFATTNSRTYLKSQTGNRRFWSVRIGKIDLEGLSQDRDQLWAEAVRMEASGRPLSLPEAFWKEAGELQDSRMDHDPWIDILQTLNPTTTYPTADGTGVEVRVATRTVLQTTLGLSADKLSDSVTKRLHFAMEKLGWTGPEQMRVEKEKTRGYRRAPRTAGTE